MARTQSASTTAQSHGRPRSVFREALRDPKSVIAGSLFHDRMSPKLIEFQRGSTLQTAAPDELLADLLGRPVTPAVRTEFAELQPLLSDRYHRQDLPFPPATQLSDPQSYLLYALVRELHPTTVFETGVANGHSSFILLRALERNQAGTLWSTDISDRVGALVDPPERSRWNLRILPVRGVRAAFQKLLNEMGPIDLFEHDSDHSFGWQTFELDSAWRKLRPGAVLAVDDADWSWATLDFARKVRAPLRSLVTTSRVCGVLRRPS